MESSSFAEDLSQKLVDGAGETVRLSDHELSIVESDGD